ncbi:MAG: hypothetical protein LC790_19305 [Actinobacteria bacterium]|nr:hypothetical protein [Actinomycetota bacterium]
MVLLVLAPPGLFGWPYAAGWTAASRQAALNPYYRRGLRDRMPWRAVFLCLPMATDKTEVLPCPPLDL